MTAPVYTTWADGTRLQRLDTLGLSWAEMIGVRVYHPSMQAGDNCAWTLEEVFALEEACGAAPLSDAEKDEERAEWPEGVVMDSGSVISVFVDKDFSDRTQVRFKDLGEDGHGLHYDWTNLWVVVDAPKEAP